MSDLRIAAQQALEVLIRASSYYDTYPEIAALEKALAIIEPEIKDNKEPRLLPWKGLTEEEVTYYKACGFVGVKAVEEKLRARNSTLACHQGEEGK